MYERDPDHVTRGVGAIAAADHVSPARHRRRVQVGRDLRRRDRAMSAIAHGALGMVVTGDPAPTTSAYKPALRLPKGPVLRVNIPGLLTQKPPVLALPPVISPPIVATPVPVVSPPIVAPTVKIVPVVPVAPVTISGGGPPVIRTMPITITEGPSLPEVPLDQADHSTRNVVLTAAGAGVLAYFLFFRRRT